MPHRRQISVVGGMYLRKEELLWKNRNTVNSVKKAKQSPRPALPRSKADSFQQPPLRTDKARMHMRRLRNLPRKAGKLQMQLPKHRARQSTISDIPPPQASAQKCLCARRRYSSAPGARLSVRYVPTAQPLPQLPIIPKAPPFPDAQLQCATLHMQ